MKYFILEAASDQPKVDYVSSTAIKRRPLSVKVIYEYSSLKTDAVFRNSLAFAS
jgi:hypothetical protein